LQKNIAINNAKDQITLVKKGVSDKKGRFYLRKGLGASGYLVADKPSRPELFHTIGTVALDDYVAAEKMKAIDLIKVDIEGGEFRFLQGAQKTLKKMKPILLIELRDELLKRSGSSFDAVKIMLTDMDYDLYKSNYNDDYFAIQPSHKITAVLKRERFKKI
jgi:FkbM family methyltransferase